LRAQFVTRPTLRTGVLRLLRHLHHDVLEHGALSLDPARQVFEVAESRRHADGVPGLPKLVSVAALERANAHDLDLLAMGEICQASEKYGGIGPIRAPPHLLQQSNVAAQLLSDLFLLRRELGTESPLLGLCLSRQCTERMPVLHLPGQAGDQEQR